MPTYRVLPCSCIRRNAGNVQLIIQIQCRAPAEDPRGPFGVQSTMLLSQGLQHPPTTHLYSQLGLFKVMPYGWTFALVYRYS